MRETHKFKSISYYKHVIRSPNFPFTDLRVIYRNIAHLERVNSTVYFHA
jgi:hypothetical protein